MKPKDIVVGKFYVKNNGSLIRLVDSEGADGNLLWYDLDLDDGKPGGTGICSRTTVAQWASREATPEEINRMQVDRAKTIASVRAHMKILDVLGTVSNEQLLDEVRRRGLSLE